MNVQIANPIYDTVFKYLMSDSRIARALLSAIIGEKIVELDFSATERVLRKDVDREDLDLTLEQLTVCRFDFRAKIKTDDGYKTVLIELQKARMESDIMRFRRYLGELYQDVENSYDDDKLKPRQIYCVYILNHCAGYKNRPVVRVGNFVTDVATEEQLDSDNEFVNGLNHLSWIVQVEYLKEKRRNELERLLSIFDQSCISGNRHILEIDESLYPEGHRRIIRKLREAFASKEVRENMKLEDDYFDELIRKEAFIAKQREVIVQKDRALAQNAKALAKKDEALAKNVKELAKKDEALAKKDEALAQKESELAEKNFRTALKMLEKGMSIEDVSEVTGLSARQIQQLQQT